MKVILLNPLDFIMGVEEAAERWELTHGSVKNLCARGRVEAVKIGKTWILRKDQPKPIMRNEKSPASE